MKFAERLREAREKRGLSQARLADEIGCSKSAISMYENGTRTPDFETMEAIADLFNLDIDYLLGRDDRSAYYLDPEVAELAQALYERPEMRVLFDASRKATKEDIEQVADILARLSTR